jgi:hypothetical protein
VPDGQSPRTLRTRASWARESIAASLIPWDGASAKLCVGAIVAEAERVGQ